MRREKKLKIISTRDEDYDTIVTKAGHDNLDHSSGWYLHGKLEDLCHYDIATIYNMSEFPEDRRETLMRKIDSGKINPHLKSYLHGIYPVKVYGVSEECVGIFWIADEQVKTASCFYGNSGDHRKFIDWDQRGLVCLKSDKEAIEYAKQKYIENISLL